MDGLAALIQGKEYTYEHKGVIYSLGQAFDETEKVQALLVRQMTY
ncbi:hypothetical protein [Aminipila sp.]|nr:hypothetical protein [Aminipila sp.]